MRRVPVLALVLLLASPAAAAPDGFEDGWTEELIAGGVLWLHRDFDDLFGGWQRIDVLAIEPSRADLALRPATGGDGACRATSVSAQAVGAIAAVNAGFFGGPCVHVGELQISGDVLATQSWENPDGRTTMGWIPHQDFRFATVAPGESLPDVWHALGAGPRLVRDGAVAEEAESGFEGFDHGANKHPRTAVAVTGGGLVLLVTVDGRTGPLGMTFPELAEFLVGLGVVHAMNLDGGGSTTMWIDGVGVANVPSDGGERSVHSVLAVVPTDGAPVADTVEGDRSVILGETTTFDGSASYDPDGDPLAWHWRLVARPEGSVRSVTTGSVESILFTPDVEGTYTIDLWVDDGEHVSEVHTVTVAAHVPTAADDVNDGPSGPGSGGPPTICALPAAAGGPLGVALAVLAIARRRRHHHA